MSGLYFSLFRFSLRPVEPLHLPRQNKGNVLRGAFGTMLRRLCCHPQCPGATRCEIRHSCPYAGLFEPGAPPGAQALSNYEAIPRPFIFRPPLEGKTLYSPDEPLEFGLVLVGSAAEFLPYVVVTFAQLAAEGFGLNRARVKLERVEQMDAEGGIHKLVYDGASGVMYQPAAPMPTNGLRPSASSLKPQVSSLTLAVRFLTPTHLVFEEKTVREPEFHHLIRRLRDRLNALATFYCGGPLELDFKGLAERAGRVRCTQRNLTWDDRTRSSSKSGRRHDVGGFVGCCEFEGEFAEFLPLLAAGEQAHVGKHTAWGNGWMEVGQAFLPVPEALRSMP